MNEKETKINVLFLSCPSIKEDLHKSLKKSKNIYRKNVLDFKTLHLNFLRESFPFSSRDNGYSSLFRYVQLVEKEMPNKKSISAIRLASWKNSSHRVY
ncbi:MAG: hypothetical protein LBV67_11795 [Streptococcaceae bacterium]|nr:hypothetical protein [Streptococcaceae bacterium]